MTSSPERQKSLEKAFDKYDLDKSGDIDCSELEAVLEAANNDAGINFQQTRQQCEVMAKKIIQYADKNNDGKISRDEFVKIYNLLNGDKK